MGATELLQAHGFRRRRPTHLRAPFASYATVVIVAVMVLIMAPIRFLAPIKP
jgi:hypothetical protein